MSYIGRGASPCDVVTLGCFHRANLAIEIALMLDLAYQMDKTDFHAFYIFVMNTIVGDFSAPTDNEVMLRNYNSSHLRAIDLMMIGL